MRPIYSSERDNKRRPRDIGDFVIIFIIECY